MWLLMEECKKRTDTAKVFPKFIINTQPISHTVIPSRSFVVHGEQNGKNWYNLKEVIFLGRWAKLYTRFDGQNQDFLQSQRLYSHFQLFLICYVLRFAIASLCF